MNAIISWPAPLLGLVLSSLLMGLLWVYQRRYRNAGVVDVGWAVSLAIFAGTYAVVEDGGLLRRSVLALMIVVWAGRLSYLLLRRMLHEKQEDRRYQRLREDWDGNIQLKFFLLFQIEAVLALVLSLPFWLAARHTTPGLGGFEILGVVLWLAGIAGETLSDEQLHDFKSRPENRGKVCQQGFWNYSRHPNYFFEWLMWVAYFVYALGAPYGWTGIIAPVIMWFFLTRVTGIPFAEKMSIQSRGEAYRIYQQSTSFFIPLPKRRVS